MLLLNSPGIAPSGHYPTTWTSNPTDHFHCFVVYINGIMHYCVNDTSRYMIGEYKLDGTATLKENTIPIPPKSEVLAITPFTY